MDIIMFTGRDYERTEAPKLGSSVNQALAAIRTLTAEMAKCGGRDTMRYASHFDRYGGAVLYADHDGVPRLLVFHGNRKDAQDKAAMDAIDHECITAGQFPLREAIDIKLPPTIYRLIYHGE